MHSARSLYASFVKPLARRAGIHEPLASAYWRLRSTGHPPSVTHEVAGTTANFRVTTTEEYRRFRNLREERAVIADLLASVEPDDVVFDVGANVGTYTCFLARRLPPERVVAFEPHPANVAALRANLERNDADATVVDRALSDGGGTGELAVESHSAGAGEHALATDGEGVERAGAVDETGDVETGGVETGDDESGNGETGHGETGGAGTGPVDAIEIDLAAGDDLVAEGAVPAPTVLKVDVEGAERRVLEGLTDSLDAGSVRLVYVEVHPDRLPAYGDEPGDVEALLARCGFAVERLADRGDEHFLRASSTSAT